MCTESRRRNRTSSVTILSFGALFSFESLKMKLMYAAGTLLVAAAVIGISVANEGRVEAKARNPFDGDSEFEFAAHDDGHVANVVKRAPQSRFGKEVFRDELCKNRSSRKTDSQ